MEAKKFKSNNKENIMKINYLTGVLSCLLITTSLFASDIPSTNAPPSEVTSPQSLININTVDAKTLSKSVKGIGVKRAEAIIAYREKNQKFKSLDELALVPGLGKNFVTNHSEELKKTFTVE